MSKPLKKDATYADLCAVPDNFVAEILGGELYASPRPASPHARAAGALFRTLGGPFEDGENGPGGWWFIDRAGAALRRGRRRAGHRRLASRANADGPERRAFHAGARLALRSAVAVHESHRSPQEAPDLCPRGCRRTCGSSIRCNKRSRCCASSRNVGRWWPRTKRTPRCEPSRSTRSSSRSARSGCSGG